MRVFNQYGSKQRLIEMMKRVNNLNEALLPKEKKVELINDFVRFVGNKLEYGDELPKIILSDDEKEAESIFKCNIKFSISFEKLKQISKFIKSTSTFTIRTTIIKITNPIQNLITL